MREGAHIACPLYIILPTQWVNPDPGLAQIAGGHGQVSNGHYCGRALAMFRHAQTVINGCGTALSVKACCLTQALGRYQSDRLGLLGAVFGLADKIKPLLGTLGIRSEE